MKVEKSKVVNGLIVNNVVKMAWKASQFFETRNGNFTCAIEIYSTPNGEIPVLFTPNTAFIWAENDGADIASDIWSVAEVKHFLKEDTSCGGKGHMCDENFPTNFDQYNPIIPYGERDCLPMVLEKFGLTEFKADIEARLSDVAPYDFEQSFA